MPFARLPAGAPTARRCVSPAPLAAQSRKDKKHKKDKDKKHKKEKKHKHKKEGKHKHSSGRKERRHGSKSRSDSSGSE